MKFVRPGLVVIGLGFIAVAVWEIYLTVSVEALPNLLAWLVGGIIIHDGIIAPIVIVIGLFLSKTLPATIRPIIQGGLAVGAVLIAISIPVVLAFGRYPGNPTLLPLNYKLNLVIILAVVVLVTGLLVGIRLWRLRGAPPADENHAPAG